MVRTAISRLQLRVPARNAACTPLIVASSRGNAGLQAAPLVPSAGALPTTASRCRKGVGAVLRGSEDCHGDVMPSTRLVALLLCGYLAALQTDQRPHACRLNEPQSKITAQQRMMCDALMAILRPGTHAWAHRHPWSFSWTGHHLVEFSCSSDTLHGPSQCQAMPSRRGCVLTLAALLVARCGKSCFDW